MNPSGGSGEFSNQRLLAARVAPCSAACPIRSRIALKFTAVQKVFQGHIPLFHHAVLNMMFPNFAIKSRFPMEQAAAAVRQEFPSPPTGSWPKHSARTDFIRPSSFQFLILAYSVSPLVISGESGFAEQEVVIRIRPYGGIVWVALFLLVPIAYSFWLWMGWPFPFPRFFRNQWVIWGSVLFGIANAGGMHCWHAWKVARTIRTLLTSVYGRT